ncbi:MAG: TolC family protein, partial [Pseudomonadota bacterium]
MEGPRTMALISNLAGLESIGPLALSASCQRAPGSRWQETIRLRVAVCLALSVIALPTTAMAAERRVVTLEDAMAAAVRHPDVRQARAGAAGARARADQARAPLLPQVSASASYSLGDDPREGPLHPSHGLGTSISGSLLLWDHDQTSRRWSSARASADAQDAAVGSIALSARGRAREAFFAARAEKALLEVARETLVNEERHLGQVQGFVAAGARPEIDLYQVRVAVANARVVLVQTENAYEIAKAQLNAYMGAEGDTDYDVADDTIAPVPGESSTTDVLFEEAIRTRPELRSLALQRRAQELSLDAARRAWWPTVRAAVAPIGTLLPFDPTWGWSASVALAWDLFDGGGRRAALRETEAALGGLDAEADGLRQQVRLELEQARLAVRAAREALVSA